MNREAESQLVFDLNQAEMLGIMASVQTGGLIGIDNDQLIPDNEAEQTKLALSGIDQLEKKGWVQRSQDDPSRLRFDPNLGMMAPALAYPEAMFLVTQDKPGKTQTQFRYYCNSPVYLALDMPNPNTYRLIGIRDGMSMLQVMRNNLPVTEDPKIEPASFSLSIDAFMEAKSLAEQGTLSQASALLATGSGASAAAAQALAQAMHRPIFGGTIAFLKLEDQQVVDGRNVAIVQNETASWTMQPQDDDPSQLLIQTVTPASYSQLLLDNVRAVVSA